MQRSATHSVGIPAQSAATHASSATSRASALIVPLPRNISCHRPFSVSLNDKRSEATLLLTQCRFTHLSTKFSVVTTPAH